jgi:hypothetical protein
MRNILYFFLILLSVMISACSSDKQPYKDLPYIDVGKSYPEKEIVLTDIADVTYLHLNTINDDFLYKGSIDYVTENTIVVADRSSYSVLFFSKDGNPKSHFNRRGQGPEEYTNVAILIYDEEVDEVYITPFFSEYINVYSSSGEYKRKIALPQRNISYQMVLFDDRSILVYDGNKLWQNIGNSYSGDNKAFVEPIDSTFFLISRTDGTVLEYINLPVNNIDLSIKGDWGYGEEGFARVRKCPDGLFLYNPETDTIFLYGKDKSLTPYLHKKPLLKDLDPLIAMDNCMDVGEVLFMSIIRYMPDGITLPTYYTMDKETGEIFRQKIILPDYKGKDFYINPRLPNYYEKGYHFELDLYELKEADRENKLSGKLKELVATLNEDEDNNVLVLVNFK